MQTVLWITLLAFLVLWIGFYINKNIAKKNDIVVVEDVVEDTPELDPFEGISEPVFSFVKTFKENPKRFKISGECINEVCNKYLYTLKDKHNDNIFEIITHGYPNYFNMSILFHHEGVKNTEFLNQKELRYIYKELSGYQTDRRIKISDYKTEKTQKRIAKQRDKYINDYCKETTNVQDTTTI